MAQQALTWRGVRATPDAAGLPRDARARVAACSTARTRAVLRAPALRLAGAVNTARVRLAATRSRAHRASTRCCASADAGGEARTIGSAALALALCNMCRVAMSVAILPIAREVGWQPAVQGLVQAAFLYGYTASQIQGGVLADRLGGKAVVAAAIVVFCAASLLTPLSLSAAAVSAGVALPLMLLVRALVGLGEGVVLPAVTNMLALRVPPKRRASAVGAAFAGFHSGTILGLLLSPAILARFSWHSLFYLYGALGLPVLLAWQAIVPETSPGAKLAAADGGPTIPQLLRSRPVWAIIFANMVNHHNYFVYLFMLPTYFSSFWHLDIRASALYSLLPWVAMGGMSYISGAIADALLPRLGTTTVRKSVQSVAFLGSAALLSLLLKCATPGTALACLTCALGLASFGQAGFVSNIQDVGGRSAGRLFGIANTAGCAAGIAGTTAAGYILQSGSWATLFQLMTALYVAGALIYVSFASGEAQF